jgi:WD40 repeat protein
MERSMNAVRLILVVVLVSGASSTVRAQTECQQPLSLPRPAGPNIFSEQQEMILGDIIAEHAQRDFRVIEDELADYLARVGQRILDQLPPTGIRFRFFLIDLPRPDALSALGGRIYVTRKMIAFVRSEDELAGVLAHEIAHSVGRDSAVSATRLFEKQLGVKEVGDRNDLLEKYNRLVDQFIGQRQRRRVEPRDGLDEQVAADRLAIQAAARAGYNPAAYAELMDRLLQTQGKTGNWFTDLFGSTRPESRRLRETLRALSGTLIACAGSPVNSGSAEFNAWRESVITYSGLGRKEELPEVAARRELNPPLRSTVHHLRFSPDGKYLLAQDETSIYVLSREPFDFLFRIDAEDARAADFSPDSKAVVFHTSSLRVESWDVEQESQTSVRELVVTDGCLQTELCPGGQALACLTRKGDLLFVDVASALPTLLEKSFFTFPAGIWLWVWLLQFPAQEGIPDFINMRFSPDGRYFVAQGTQKTVALEVDGLRRLDVPGSVKRLLPLNFAFVRSDQLAGVDANDYKKSALVRFPSGELISRLPLGRQRLAATRNEKYLLLRPVQKHAVGALNLETHKALVPGKSQALDVFGEWFVKEDFFGNLGIYALASYEKPVATLDLPFSRLGRPRVFAISRDLQWFALSDRHRGAVWNLANGTQAYAGRAFRGAHFTPDGILWADFPKFEEMKRSILGIHLKSDLVYQGYEIEEKPGEQHGRFVTVLRTTDEKGRPTEDANFEVRDFRTGMLKWVARFGKGAPRLFPDPVEEMLVLFWDASDGSTKERFREEPAIRTRLAALKDTPVCLVESLSLENGERRALTVVAEIDGKTVRDVAAAADTLVLEDATGRVHLFSVAHGDLRGRVFGRRPVLAPSGAWLAVDEGEGVLGLYDARSAQKRERLVFSHPVAAARFSQDGTRLVVLTADQTLFIIDLMSQNSPAS